MAFHLGSLGFLTPFKFDSYKAEVAKVLEGAVSRLFPTGRAWSKCKRAAGPPGNAAITLRSRLKVKVVKDALQRGPERPRGPETPRQERNGLHASSEFGKVTLQLQVRTASPHTHTHTRYTPRTEHVP